ncbi:hypothetical protein D6D01_08671 [Aureobasidium pullulans]|uniref:Uncharacterized protein n=1 Tax=Aureobasidium pullulans TaxID=5580 RepID=A0A4S9KA91_AURPU|nr:hypothetical protein D6D01_08671 [Aureobasidium pullulans]
MSSQIADDLGAQTLVDSVVTIFTNVFAGSSTLFITLGLLIFITRILVRLGTSNYWGAFTKDQHDTIFILSGILGFVHLILSLCYATDDASGLPTAPSYYWAICWSMATLTGICGGLGVGLVVFVVVSGGI